MPTIDPSMLPDRLPADYDRLDSAEKSARVLSMASGDYARFVRPMLATGDIDVEHRGDGGNTALLAALGGRRLPNVLALLAAGAKVNVVNDLGETVWNCLFRNFPLPQAEDPNDTIRPLVKALIDHGADVNQVGFRPAADSAREQERPPLFLACMARRYDIVHALLEAGANPHAKDPNGRTVLHDLIVFRDPERPMDAWDTFEYLLDHYDVDINALTKQGWSPLDTVSYKGLCEFSRRAIQERGARPRQPIDALVIGTAQHGRMEWLPLLQPWGDASLVKDFNGHSPLAMMLSSSITNAAEQMRVYLQQFPATDLHQPDDHGETLLHAAAWGGHTDAIKPLIEAGLHVDTLNAKGWTPMRIVVKNSRPNDHLMIRTLLDEGSDPHHPGLRANLEPNEYDRFQSIFRVWEADRLQATAPTGQQPRQRARL